ncbi:hypothetical protein D3C81_2089970 [compost metagenome]
MVADTLQRTQYPDNAQNPRDRTRIFHHVGRQLTQGSLVFAVDDLVVLRHRQGQLGIETGKGVQCITDHVAHLVTDVAHFDVTARCLAFFA